MRYRNLLCSIVVMALFAAVSSSQIKPVGANPLANWTPELNLSDWQEEIYDYRLKLGADGTLAAFWVTRNSAKTQWSLWSRVRQPGADWTSAENLSGLQLPLSLEVTYWGAGVAPDGTAWALWVVEDKNVVGDKYFVRAAYRPRGGPWQSAHPSTQPAPAIADAKLEISPDGHLVAAWIECAVQNPNIAPCAVKVARRYPGEPVWEPVKRIDDGWTNTSMDDVQPLVGYSGFVVVLWQAENNTKLGEYGLKARIYDPGTDAWSPSNNTPPFSGWSNFIYTIESVMGADGTVVAAWISDAAGSSGSSAVHSATRPAASGTWGPVRQISSPGIYLAGEIALAIGEDGTAAAAWSNKNLLGNYPIYASARDPGSTWDIETQLSGSQYKVYRMDIGVWPDGEALVVWGGDDTSRPDPSSSRLYWSLRPPNNNWGIAEGSLGAWMDTISGLDLALGNDRSAALVWSFQENSAGFYGAQAASWPPGGPWDAPSPLASQYSATFMFRDGLVMGPEGQPVAGAWLALDNVASFEAVSFSEQIFPPPTGGGYIYLPLVVKSP